MKHGVFINQLKANCSIYESGIVIKDILKTYLKDYTLDYFETDTNLSGFNWYPYSFTIINWHPHTLAVRQDLVKKLPGLKIVIVVEVSPDNYIPFTPDWFDAYMIIDPTKEKKGKFYPFSRPIEKVDDLRPLLDKDKLIMGSFGLYSKFFKSEKRFEEIIRAANRSKRKCIVRINLPWANYTYTPYSDIQLYGYDLRNLAKPHVDVRISHDYMSKQDLIRWLSEHTLNAFPYYRNRPGLAAVADQAISSGRGLIVTECDTFRHIHKYIDFYPKQSYEELAISTLNGVKKMQLDWSYENFRRRFDELLTDNKVI